MVPTSPSSQRNTPPRHLYRPDRALAETPAAEQLLKGPTDRHVQSRRRFPVDAPRPPPTVPRPDTLPRLMRETLFAYWGCLWLSAPTWRVPPIRYRVIPDHAPPANESIS
jgi:hypothetical protein